MLQGTGKQEIEVQIKDLSELFSKDPEGTKPEGERPEIPFGTGPIKTEPPAATTEPPKPTEAPVVPPVVDPEPAPPAGGPGGDFHPSNDVLKGALDFLIGKGVIPDVSQDAFTDGEGNEVEFKDLKFKTSEEFYETLSELISEKQKEDLAGKVDLSKTSDILQKAYDIEAAGGDPLEVMKINKQFISPLDGKDFDSRKDCLEIVRHYCNAVSEKIGKDEADDLYDSITKMTDEDVRTKARKYDGFLRAEVDKWVEQYKKDTVERKAAAEASAKKYRKDLREYYTKDLKLTTNSSDKLVDFATKIDPETRMTNFDKAIADKLRNPSTAAGLIAFLFNENEYRDLITHKAVNAEAKRSWKIASTSNKSPRTQAPVDNEGELSEGILGKMGLNFSK